MAVSIRQDSVYSRKFLYNLIALYKSRQDIKIYLEILLSLGTIIIFGILAIKPTLVTIATLSAEVQAKQELVNTLDKKIQDLSIAQQQYEQIKDALPLLEQAVPSQPEIDKVIKQIEGLAQQNNVFVETVSTKNISIIGELAQINTPEIANQAIVKQPLPMESKELEITFSASGEYQNLISFLKKTEEHRRPPFIDSVSFNTVVKQIGQDVVITIKMRLPYIKQSQPE